MNLFGNCATCLGCNKLLNKDFKGMYRCPNYMKGRTENEKESSSDKIRL